ncbi:MAG: DUF2530 domain-containing protein [Acidobacteria bacterium]|nr:MAG: DUF2530 domain-containing protein [Acidobacteriota bacterium]
MTESAASGRPASPDDVEVPDPGLRTSALVLWGTLAWLVVLAVLLLVPPLRSGDRSWWVWVPVAGVAGGLLGYGYLRRGRGNARFAD